MRHTKTKQAQQPTLNINSENCLHITAVLALVLWPTCAGGAPLLECTAAEPMADAMPFCRDILLNETIPSYQVATIMDPLSQDSLARQASETVLNMATS